MFKPCLYCGQKLLLGGNFCCLGCKALYTLGKKEEMIEEPVTLELVLEGIKCTSCCNLIG